VNLLRLQSPSGSFARLSLTCGIIGSLALAACGGYGGSAGYSQPSPPAPASGPPGTALVDSALVSNKEGVVATVTTIDANLSNPWGLAVAPGKPFWIADNNSNLTTLYSGTGTVETHLVTGSTDAGIAIPASAAGVPANPTGQIYNASGGFLIATTKGEEPAQFIFDGEGGTISAWAQDSGSTAVTVYDDGAINGANAAVYKGLAVATVNGAPFLYATDLHNGKVDVFDTHFAKPADLQGKFVDPSLPAGYVPFGIAALGGQLYVTYAVQDDAKHDETTGAGLGYVNVFDLNGNLVSRFASVGVLNAPWGIAVAPAGFGSFEGDLLIGNFGDGRINVFKPNGTGEATSLGPLTVSNGGTVVIPGLWSLVFGNGDADKPVTTLFYTAGFANQTDGVFGSISSGTAMSSPNPYGG
jgi:uncharacterized protein (TIGR03118 family)